MRTARVVVAALALAGLLAGTTPSAAAADDDEPGGTEAGGGPRPSVGFVGDSVPFQAIPYLTNTLGRDRRIAYGQAGLGYKVRTVMPNTRAAVVNNPDGPDIFLVFLGTAQSHSDKPHRWRNELRGLLAMLHPHVDCIRVFDIDQGISGFYQHHDRYAKAYNRITRAVVGEFAKAEWYHYSLWADLAGPEFERRDTLHHNKAGSAQIARLMRHAAVSCDPGLTTGPFWDVPDAHPAADAIAWVHERRLFRGYPNGTYRAEIGTFVLPATRGQLLNMTWRLAGRPTGYGPHPWRDGRAALEAALRWAAAEGVGSGYPNRTYRPDATATRGQAVNLLWRAAGRPRVQGGPSWSDVSGPAFRWVRHHRLLGGYADGTFRPQSRLSRAQLATLLHRFDALPAPAAGAPPEGAPEPPSTTAPPTTAPPTTAPPVDGAPTTLPPAGTLP